MHECQGRVMLMTSKGYKLIKISREKACSDSESLKSFSSHKRLLSFEEDQYFPNSLGKESSRDRKTEKTYSGKPNDLLGKFTGL